jgi:SEC-C motif-containing protein
VLATTPEQLMRSRFSAYALGEVDHVFRTWHPRTRPDDLAPDPRLTWTRLEVLDATGDEVEFLAHYETPSGPGVLHERSTFEQRGGRWVYVSAVA